MGSPDVALPMLRPAKLPQTGIYRVRKALPEPLRTVAGRREWIVSLGTKDPAEAKARPADAVARD